MNSNHRNSKIIILIIKIIKKINIRDKNNFLIKKSILQIFITQFKLI